MKRDYTAVLTGENRFTAKTQRRGEYFDLASPRLRVSAVNQNGLLRQQRHSSRDEDGGHPAAGVDFLVQEDASRKGVGHERE